MTAQPTDFDLHGYVGIRLVDAHPQDVHMVHRQLGPLQRPLDREPDLWIRFVDHIDTPEPLYLLGLDDVGYTSETFLILHGKHKAPARVQIPFDRIGQPCEIVCERGLPAIPLLIPILNLIALAKDVLPLHAAAFTYQGRGVLVTGWTKGGKTETLLAFMNHGAQYIGDEWVYLSHDGNRMAGIPEPIRVWDWHLQYLPQLRARLTARERGQLALTRLLDRGLRKLVGRGNPKAGLSGFVRRALPLIQKRRGIDIEPRRLFNQAVESQRETPDVVFFVGTHAAPHTTIAPIDPVEIAKRMVFSLEQERRFFLSCYRKFRFAFPDAANPLIENRAAIQRELLLQALAGKEAYAVYHPYPVDIPALYQVMASVLKQENIHPSSQPVMQP